MEGKLYEKARELLEAVAHKVPEGGWTIAEWARCAGIHNNNLREQKLHLKTKTKMNVGSESVSSACLPVIKLMIRDGVVEQLPAGRFRPAPEEG